MPALHPVPTTLISRQWLCLLAALCVSASMLAGTAQAQTNKKPARPQQTAQPAQTTNKVGITMVNIPAGSFVMGSCPQDQKAAFLGESSCANPDREASTDETPQHRVDISAFQMGKTEVTLGQYKAFIKATGSSHLVTDDFMKNNSNGDNAAVTTVSWNDAQAFITWLNEADGGGYRLPSEAEWEYACRAGGAHTYCGSNSASSVAHYDTQGGARTVANKQPNAFGLYDMSGNVWEWVEDCWHDSYSGAPTDGSAWTSSCKSVGRVQRGGSWNYDARSTRAANRNDSSPGGRFSILGFRLARTR